MKSGGLKTIPPSATSNTEKFKQSQTRPVSKSRRVKQSHPGGIHIPLCLVQSQPNRHQKENEDSEGAHGRCQRPLSWPEITAKPPPKAVIMSHGHWSWPKSSVERVDHGPQRSVIVKGSGQGQAKVHGQLRRLHISIKTQYSASKTASFN